MSTMAMAGNTHACYDLTIHSQSVETLKEPPRGSLSPEGEGFNHITSHSQEGNPF